MKKGPSSGPFFALPVGLADFLYDGTLRISLAPVNSEVITFWSGPKSLNLGGSRTGQRYSDPCSKKKTVPKGTASLTGRKSVMGGRTGPTTQITLAQKG